MNQDIQKSIDKLSKKDWQELQDLYDEIVNHTSPFYSMEGGGVDDNDSIVLPYYKSAPIVMKVMHFLYDKKLIVQFDWGSWDEGRKMLQRTGEDKFNDISLIDAFKLLTAVARNSKFNDGAFDRFFESGDAQLLFKRILEFK